jgi:hypothetical protein
VSVATEEPVEQRRRPPKMTGRPNIVLVHGACIERAAESVGASAVA